MTGIFRHAFISALVLFVSCAFAREPEMRGIWISDPTHFHWETVVANVKKAGLNAIFVNFASAGVVFYPSKLLPYIEPDEPFSELIRLAHNEGIQVHAKVLTFFMHWVPKAAMKQRILQGRVLLNMKGKVAFQSETPWLDPAQQENRELMQNVISEILNKYRVDGLQLDYIRYFEESRVPASIMRIRQTTINGFVSETSQLVKKIRPQARYSACVFHNLRRAQNEMGQDWEAWMQQDLFSFLCPMNYTTHPKELSKWLTEQIRIQKGRTPLYSGLGAYMDHMNSDILLKEIDLVRRYTLPGFVLFSYNPKFVKKMVKPLSQALVETPSSKN